MDRRAGACRLLRAEVGAFLCPRQAAARKFAVARIGAGLRRRTRILIDTAVSGFCAGTPLRAARIFAPLSSRTAAPKTTISHIVARKARVPNAAIISRPSYFRAPTCNGLFLFQFLSVAPVRNSRCSCYVLSCQAPGFEH